MVRQKIFIFAKRSRCFPKKSLCFAEKSLFFRKYLDVFRKYLYVSPKYLYVLEKNLDELKKYLYISRKYLYFLLNFHVIRVEKQCKNSRKNVRFSLQPAKALQIKHPGRYRGPRTLGVGPEIQFSLIDLTSTAQPLTGR
jgi:hypothetical protein